MVQVRGSSSRSRFNVNAMRATAGAAAANIGRGIKRVAKYIYKNSKRRKISFGRTIPPVNANGKFRRVVWKKKRPSYRAKRFKKFRGKVMAAVNASKDKAHYIKQSTLRIESTVGRARIGSLLLTANSTLQEARRKTIFNTSLASNYDKNKLQVINSHVDIFMVNPTNACVYVDMYEVVRKGRPQSNVEEDPATWLNYYVTSNDITANTGQPALNRLATAADTYSIGFDVFQVPAFFQKWSVLKKTRTLLQPGECVTKTIKRTMDWTWDPKLYSDQSAPTTVDGVQTQGLLTNNNKKSLHLLFKVFGQVINEPTPVQQNITFSPGAINIAWTEDITIAQVHDYAPLGTARANAWVSNQFGSTIGQFIQEFNAPVVTFAEA